MRITSRPSPNNASDDVIVDGRIITAENFDSARASNGGSGADVFEWHAGDEGMDHIFGFNPAEDRLWFNAGFFQSEPGAVGLGNVLGAYDCGDDTVLAARAADGALAPITTPYAVDHVAVAQVIANGGILGQAPPANFGGMAGDYPLQ